MMIKNIVIDPGHGGIDRNGNYTTAPAKMYKFTDGLVAYEGVINRQIAWMLFTNLRVFYPNVNTVCTVKPWDSRDISLSYRVRVANKFDKNETLFISIHCNSSPKHNAGGFEIYTSKGHTMSDIIAEDIASAVEPLYEKMAVNLRYDFSDGDKDKEVDFYVLRKTKCPAVLLECGFFDYKKDLKFLTDYNYQKELAVNIIKGIKKYIKK